MTGDFGILSTLVDLADLGVAATLIIGLLLIVPRLISRFFDERRSDRHEETKVREAERQLHEKQIEGLLLGFEKFGDRVAGASERQATATEKLAEAQLQTGAQLSREIKSLELAQKATHQTLERLAAELANPERRL